MRNTKTYVTSTIPYVNARPHVGFALELVQTDAIARYHRLLGGDVRLQTGTDEHAFKNVLSARKRGLSTEALVSENSSTFRDLCDVLNVSHDRFLRTTEPAHRTAVHAFWQRLRPGDLYLKDYTGLYCIGCEDFCLDRNLINGVCPDHGAKPVEVAEENYFFRLSAYESELEVLLNSGRLTVMPDSRKNEVLQFVRSGLSDISVSRVAKRAGGWGIPVPGDPSQVVYVWVDALVNYLSGLGFGSDGGWDEFWNDDMRKIHVIGKNVWKFHAVYWPAFLLSAGLPLPNTIVVHGFLTVDGRKISKSLGNSVDPVKYVSDLGSDAVRYYLLRYVRPFEDGDFSTDRLTDVYNADLANGLGNLCSRLTALCEKAGYGAFDIFREPHAPEGFHSALRRFEFHTGLELLWRRVRAINQDIERQAPWSLIKSGAADRLHASLTKWLGELHDVAHWLRPFLPNASARIKAILTARVVRRGEALFPRMP